MNWELAPDNTPSAGVVLMKLAGKAGRPVSSVVSGEPTFLPRISAARLEVAPEQIVFGVATCRSCSQLAGVTLDVPLGGANWRKPLAPGPLLLPHQLSLAVRVPARRNIAIPFVGVPTELPANRENVTMALPPDTIAPPDPAAWFVANELVVTVSGPLSTLIAPPLPADALLPEKLELLTV